MQEVSFEGTISNHGKRASFVSVIDAGAVGDGATPNTLLLQQLIDKVGKCGGGKVFFPPGVYLTGGLVLCNGLHLHLAKGAVLLGSPRLEDYPHYNPSPVPFPEGYEGVRALLSAVNCRDIVIDGPGVIDGQGAAFEAYPEVRGGRPRNLWFAQCQHIEVRNLELRNSGFWMQHYLNCSDVKLDSLKIWNHAGTNNDGIDIDGCRDVTIENCTIDSSDDAICLKSATETPTENVVVRNCRTSSHCNHFKTGTESRGGFRDIRVSGLTMVPSAVRESHAMTEGADWRGACGIALGAVDGGSLIDIEIRDISMEQVRVPFFIRLGDRGYCPPGVAPAGELPIAERISIADVHAKDAGSVGGHIVGLPNSPVREVVIENCSFCYEEQEGGEDLDAAIPQAGKAYPSACAFGTLPAFGVFLRDVENISFEEVEFHPAPGEIRPALFTERAHGIQVKSISDGDALSSLSTEAYKSTCSSRVRSMTNVEQMPAAVSAA